MKIITLVLASLLALPKSHAKRVGAAVRVPPSAPKETWPHKEDDTYWSRLLQADGSMSLPVPTSPPPTPPPVPVPTPPPTPSPTTPDEECIVDVTVACEDADGTDCNEIEPPPGNCAVGSEIANVRFEYTGDSCEAGDSNTQDDYDCEDFEGGPPADTEVLVTCSDGTTEFVSETVGRGDDITIGEEDGGALPDLMICTISSIDSSTTYQVMTINTSGDVNLYLKDKFGALQLESCDDNDCITTATYSYTLENIGTTPMTITVVDRERDGETTDLLALVPDTELGVGDRTVVTEMEEIDLCVDSSSTTSVEAEADPPTGSPCFDEDTYTLVTEVPCRVAAEIDCVTGEGVPCDRLQPVDNPNDPEECFTTTTYIYSVRNIGGNEMTITDAEVIFNDVEVEDILDLFDELTLQPGEEATSSPQQRTLDLCASETTVTVFNVDANAPNGQGCEDTDEYELEIDAATPPSTTPPGIPMPTPGTPTPLPDTQMPTLTQSPTPLRDDTTPPPTIPPGIPMPTPGTSTPPPDTPVPTLTQSPTPPPDDTTPSPTTPPGIPMPTPGTPTPPLDTPMPTLTQSPTPPPDDTTLPPTIPPGIPMPTPGTPTPPLDTPMPTITQSPTPPPDDTTLPPTIPPGFFMPTPGTPTPPLDTPMPTLTQSPTPPPDDTTPSPTTPGILTPSSDTPMPTLTQTPTLPSDTPTTPPSPFATTPPPTTPPGIPTPPSDAPTSTVTQFPTQIRGTPTQPPTTPPGLPPPPFDTPMPTVTQTPTLPSDTPTIRPSLFASTPLPTTPPGIPTPPSDTPMPTLTQLPTLTPLPSFVPTQAPTDSSLT